MYHRSCCILSCSQIHINGRDEIDALVNGHVINFDEQPLAEFSGGVLVKSVGTSKYVAIFNSGISVGVEKAEDILQLMLFVPTIFKGTVSILNPFNPDSVMSKIDEYYKITNITTVKYCTTAISLARYFMCSFTMGEIA